MLEHSLLPYTFHLLTVHLDSKAIGCYDGEESVSSRKLKSARSLVLLLLLFGKKLLKDILIFLVFLLPALNR